MPDEPVTVTAFVIPVESFGVFESVERRFTNSETRFAQAPFYEDTFVALKAYVDATLGTVLSRASYAERVAEIERDGRAAEFAAGVLRILKEQMFDRIIAGIETWCRENAPADIKEFQEKYPASLPVAHQAFFSEFVMAQHFVTWFVHTIHLTE